MAVMRWPNYAAVRFTTDDFRTEGAPIGVKGYIVEVYDDAYEVEVSNLATGETVFLGAVQDHHLELLDEP
jgi:hypothetical protein